MTNTEPAAAPHRPPAQALVDFAISQSRAVFYISALEKYEGEHGPDAPRHFVSNNMKDIIGYEQDLFYDDREFGYSLMHPDDLDSYMKMLAKLKETGKAYETYRMRSASGDWLWFRDEVRLLPRDGNRPHECVGCMVEVTAEKETELALRRTQAFNHAIVEASQQGIVSVNVRGMIVGFNPSAEALFGHSLDAVLGKPVADLIVPEHLRGRHHDGFTRCVETGESSLIGQKIETEALHADGHLIPVELAFSRIEIDGDTQFVAEIRDISERVEADQRSQRAVQLLQDAVDSLPHGFSVLDKEGDYAVCNRAFAQIYGLEPEQLVGLNRADMIHLLTEKVESVAGEAIDGPESLTEALTQTLGAPVEVKLRSGDWWQVTRQKTSDGGIAALRSDITTLKAAEEAASNSNAFILSLMNACPLPFGMTRLDDGFVIYESPASKHLFQRGLDGKPAHAISNFKSPRQREVYVEILKRDGFVDDFQIEALRADGSEFPASLTARLVEFEGEEVIVFATDDLTRQHEIEAEMARQQEALYQSEKLSALGELLAGIAHELNNPLSVLVGQALMLSETAVDAKTRERAEKIGSAADRCARIVKAFLAMARQQPTRSAETEINELVEGALEMTAYALRSSDVTVQLQLSDELPVIHGDPDQLRQVLINLLVNAQHALEEVEGERKLKISTRYLKRSREVVLKVKDNGPGVSVDMQRRIFEPLFTTKEVGIGTGIGLALCHRIITSHGGRIKVESSEEGGATFVVRFPVSVPGIEDAEKSDVNLTSAGQGKLLVVDDEVDVGSLVAEILQRDGYDVSVATSGEDALKLLGQEHFDAVISDLRMPGMDGRELHKRLAGDRPDLAIKLGFMTGDTMSGRARDFLEASGRPFIEKPISPAELRWLIETLLGTGPETPS